MKLLKERFQALAERSEQVLGEVGIVWVDWELELVDHGPVELRLSIDIIELRWTRRRIRARAMQSWCRNFGKRVLNIVFASVVLAVLLTVLPRGGKTYAYSIRFHYHSLP